MIDWAPSYLHSAALVLWLLIVTMCTGSVVQFLFLRGLRKRHSSQWIHAGCPTMWTDQSIASAWPTVRYMQKREFLGSSNACGIAFCESYRTPFVTLYWLTLATFIAIVAAFGVFGVPPGWR
ncbi:MAG: hypothetical protein V4631_19100 [Pseudomonadota bacterium]